MTNQEKAQKFAKSAPKLSEDERRQINDLFPAYIFRRTKTREVWTTCCGQHVVLGSGEHPEIMGAEHQREPNHYNGPRPIPGVCCPFCGRRVVIKELGRTGRRENLWNYQRAMVLRWYRGALWGTAYEAEKRYESKFNLTAPPRVHLMAVYRWRPGLAEATQRYFYDYPFTAIEKQDYPMQHGKWRISKPFCCTSEFGIGYTVIGLKEIQKSPFRYCMAEQAEKRVHFEKFLTACCFYPRQIEMLMKAGMEDVVFDLTLRGVKHAQVIDWDETNPAKAFKVDRAVLRKFLDTGRDIEVLELYKKAAGTVSMELCEHYVNNLVDARGTAAAARKRRIPLAKLLRYLDTGKDMGGQLRYWKDYVEAAEAMAYPLYRENVLMPKDLITAHDKATGEFRNIKATKQAEVFEDRLQKRRPKLEKKYGYEADGILIRIPASAKEIIEEGSVLEHCVAGYAEDHALGKTNILFMRKAKSPDTPWITIEMRGNKLIQIHGFHNECVKINGHYPIDPRQLYREFLDGWLSWLQKGSPRKKDGTPSTRKQTKKDAA